MPRQNYSNHVQYYPPHHFVFYPLAIIFIIAAIGFAIKFPDRTLEWTAIAIVMAMMTWVSFMMRQHYALNNQNRIVRLEIRLRYYQLTHKRFEEIEHQLSFGQVAALRFASDEELLPLIQRTLSEGLNPTQIKKSIKNWIPDTMRV